MRGKSLIHVLAGLGKKGWLIFWQMVNDFIQKVDVITNPPSGKVSKDYQRLKELIRTTIIVSIQ